MANILRMRVILDTLIQRRAYAFKEFTLTQFSPACPRPVYQPRDYSLRGSSPNTTERQIGSQPKQYNRKRAKKGG